MANAAMECRELAEELLALLPSRWRHVLAVARVTEDWFDQGLVDEVVLKAAWLHDIGYSAQLRHTGMHAIDGAAFLERQGLDAEVVQLVAHHTGASFEAQERGLAHELERFEAPEPADLDALTLADLVSGPVGQLLTLDERFQDIFDRYDPDHPVHRAVTRSRSHLEEQARRAAGRLGYPR